jgi:hypothetical protein
MSEKVERALEIVRNFTEAEFHSFMEMLYISESSQSNVSFNDFIGKNRFKNGIVCPHCNYLFCLIVLFRRSVFFCQFYDVFDEIAHFIFYNL